MGPCPQSGEPAMNTNTTDWRTQLLPDSRQKIVNKILDTLAKHLPFAGTQGIIELRRIASRFEERVFSSAVNQAVHRSLNIYMCLVYENDYLGKISFKMLTLETKAQDAAGSSSSTPAANNTLPFYLGYLMDNDSEPSTMNTADWRTQLPPDSRHKNVNKLMETLKKHVPYSGQEGIDELMRIAISFEELIFNTAINQADYLRKISLKMQTMEEGD